MGHLSASSEQSAGLSWCQECVPPVMGQARVPALRQMRCSQPGAGVSRHSQDVRCACTHRFNLLAFAVYVCVPLLPAPPIHPPFTSGSFLLSFSTLLAPPPAARSTLARSEWSRCWRRCCLSWMPSSPSPSVPCSSLSPACAAARVRSTLHPALPHHTPPECGC
jgi:hypothetical protein